MEKTLNKEVVLSKVINGTSWGDFDIDDKSFNLTNNGKEWFSIQGKRIANLTNPNKNEIGFEFINQENDNEE